MGMEILMKGLKRSAAYHFITLLLLNGSCREPLAPFDFKGEPLLTVSGKIEYSTVFEWSNQPFNAALLWSKSGMIAQPLESFVEQSSLSL
jgi:hypothetical protein